MATEAQEERLTQIKDGAEVMVALAQDRLREAIEALLDGDFDAACDRAGEAVSKLASLQQAQLGLARLTQPGTIIVRADALQVGDVVHGWGTVREPPERFGGGEHAQGVVVRWNDMRDREQEKPFAADAELVITRSPEGAET